MVNYAFKDWNENMAKASMRDVGISTKHSIEIINFIRDKKSADAKKILEEVIKGKQHIPFKRFNHNVGHRKGTGSSGRYPKKACQEILKLIKQCESNAQLKGLNTNNLVITHICSNRASSPWHFGRKTRQKMKRTHLELVLEEKKVAVKKGETPKEEKKPEVKTEAKKEEKTKEKISFSESQKSEISIKPEIKDDVKTETKKKDKPVEKAPVETKVEVKKEEPKKEVAAPKKEEEKPKEVPKVEKKKEEEKKPKTEASSKEVEKK